MPACGEETDLYAHVSAIMVLCIRGGDGFEEIGRDREVVRLKSKLWYLKRIDLFRDLSEVELKEIDRISRMIRVKKGQPLYLPGDPGTAVFLLKLGRIKLSRLSQEGKELILDLIEPGEVFGELSLTDGPQEAIAETLEDSLLCIIQRRDFEALLRRKPDLALKVTKFIGLRWKRIENRLEDLVFKDIPGRLAVLLLQLAQDYGILDKRGVLLRIKLSQRELANLIGASREMVNHALSEFRRKRLIDFEGRQIVILSQEALKALR